jgi:hypothetical protein
MAALIDLIARRDAYLAAELKILQSQEYTVGQGGTARRSRRADLEQVRLQIEQLNVQINAAQQPRRVLYLR